MSEKNTLNTFITKANLIHNHKYDKEIELHKLYKEYKYSPLLNFDGQTECFNISILEEILKLTP